MINLYRLFFIVTFLFISYSAFVPSDATSSIPHIDKAIHLIAFLVLSFLLDLSIKNPLNTSKNVIFFLVAYAGSIEIVQYYLTYRSAEILDFLSDLLGILVYLYFAPKIIRKAS